MSSRVNRSTRLVQDAFLEEPLGLIVGAPTPSKPQVGRSRTWVQAMFTSGATVVIPEIRHYDVRSELLRVG
jgi:hypothetical protein